MKNPLQLAINAVLLLAVAVLYYLHFSHSTPAHTARPAAVAVAADSTAAPVAEAPVEEADTTSAAPAPITAPATGDKIAYVESAKLLDGYLGMKDAKRAFEGKARGWEKQNQTLLAGFKSAVETYQKSAGGMTAEQRGAAEQKLQMQQQQVGQEQEKLQRQAQEEEAKVTSTVLGRIDKQVEAYGKANGYKLILISAPSGTIAYGRKDLDITAPVLSYLNGEYRKK
jgi:outer membrane protein